MSCLTLTRRIFDIFGAVESTDFSRRLILFKFFACICLIGSPLAFVIVPDILYVRYYKATLQYYKQIGILMACIGVIMALIAIVSFLSYRNRITNVFDGIEKTANNFDDQSKNAFVEVERSLVENISIVSIVWIFCSISLSLGPLAMIAISNWRNGKEPFELVAAHEGA